MMHEIKNCGYIFFSFTNLQLFADVSINMNSEFIIPLKSQKPNFLNHVRISKLAPLYYLQDFIYWNKMKKPIVEQRSVFQ